MGNDKSSSCRMARWGDEDEGSLFQELSDRFPEIKAESCRSTHSANQCVSLELVNRCVSFIKHLNGQSMEVCSVFPRGLWKDQLANKFLDTSLTNMKDVSEELREFLDAILNWKPLPHRHEEILAKLRRFQSRECFSDQSLRDLMELHKGIVVKGLCTVRMDAEVGKEWVLPELKPIFSLVNELEQTLSNSVHSIGELRSMKERLQKELCEGIAGINDAIRSLMAE